VSWAKLILTFSLVAFKNYTSDSKILSAETARVQIGDKMRSTTAEQNSRAGKK